MPTKPNYRRGDVVLVLFPDSNLKTVKLRPALIIQADNLNSGLAQVIVAMITTNMTRAGHPSRVTVLINSPEGHLSGLLADSVVMTDNLATIAHTEMSRVIGQLAMTSVDNALRHTLKL